MNPLAENLNNTIRRGSEPLYSSLSSLGRELFFPKGILTQTAEAKASAHRYNATIGIARSGDSAMYLPAIMDRVSGIPVDKAVGYAPATGNPALRQRWKEAIFEKNPSLDGTNISLPVVTSGITHGLTICGELFLDPEDVVVLADKSWGNYNMIFRVRRGAVVESFPFFDDGGGFNVEGLRQALSETLEARGKALLILNFPNNPTGYSIRKDEAFRLREALEEVAGPGRELVVVADDAYFGLFYDDDALEESIFALIAGRNEHLIPVKLDGATKEQYVWGFRVGFITFGLKAGGLEGDVYDALQKKIGGAIRGNISNCSQLSQSILLEAMNDPGFSGQKQEKYQTMKERAMKVRQVLEGPEYREVWEPYPFNSGYFMCLRLKDIDGEEFREKLLERYGVGVIAQGTDIRIAFSCLEVEEIPELFGIMNRCALEVRREGRTR